MIQLKLKLNSKKPTTVYAVNGKSYLLSPGSNILSLEYEDYLSLAKALGIKPVENKREEVPAKQQDSAPIEKSNPEAKEEVKSELAEEVKSEPAEEVKSEPAEEVKSEPAEEVKSEPAEEVKSEPTEEVQVEPENVEEPKEEAVSEDKIEDGPIEEVQAVEAVDYSTWTVKQLKAKYKEITGENCRLKKDEIISILQEHYSNA